MIANKLNRAKNLIRQNKEAAAKECYERAFELTDLTSADPKWSGGLKELRRFREVLGWLYTGERNDIRFIELTHRMLIMLAPEAWKMMYGE
ncbi:MAG: hypothetical protein GXO77_00745 [Calditrichaeota bacterium]|nr:hypothetical protein [Calditrichota bacterium]